MLTSMLMVHEIVATTAIYMQPTEPDVEEAVQMLG